MRRTNNIGAVVAAIIAAGTLTGGCAGPRYNNLQPPANVSVEQVAADQAYCREGAKEGAEKPLGKRSFGEAFTYHLFAPISAILLAAGVKDEELRYRNCLGDKWYKPENDNQD